MSSSHEDSTTGNSVDSPSQVSDEKDASAQQSFDSGHDAESDDTIEQGECLAWGQAQEQVVEGIRLDGLMKLSTDGIGAMALWTAFDSTVAQYRMFAAAFDGSAWGPTTTVSNNTSIFAGYNASAGQANFALAYDSESAIASWVEWTNPPRMVASTYRDGTWTTPTTISLPDAGRVNNPTVAIAETGAVVAWVQQVDDQYRLVSRRWDESWSGTG